MGAEKTNATGGYPVASPNRPGGPAFDSAGIIAENDLARKALRAMLDGKFTPNGAMSNYGGWADFVRVAQDAYTARGAAGVRAVVNVNPEALRLLSGDEPAAIGRRVRWTAGELLAADLPVTPWLIPGMIPIGLVILAGRRKLGKSFLALQMAGAIGSGGDFLGQKVGQGRCLYLALEDTAARLQGRMKMQSWRQDAQVDFALTWPALDDGGLVNLQDELTAGGYNLLVIDTLSRCLTRRQNQNDVGDMTFALSALQQTAFSSGMTILLIDHHTKASQALDLADPVDDLLGSSGKGAVADAVFGLYRHRGQREVKLLGRGRDFDELSFDLRFDGVTGCWQRDTAALTVAQQAIVDTLQRSGPMTAAKIARATEQDRSNCYARLQELLARNLITLDVTSKAYSITSKENDTQ